MQISFTKEQLQQIEAKVGEEIKSIYPGWDGAFGVAIDTGESTHSFIHAANILQIVEMAGSFLGMAKKMDDMGHTLPHILSIMRDIYSENLVNCTSHETKH